MSTTMAAKEIGAAWLAYVTETFQLKEGAIRAQVEAEYRRLAEHDDITKERELWRDYTDNLIEKILQCPAELRGQLLEAVDIRSLAFVQDRIQCGTELLAALVQKGLMLNIEDGDAALPDFFRQMLLQRATA